MTLGTRAAQRPKSRSISIGASEIEVLVNGAQSGGTLDVLMFSAAPHMPGPQPHIHVGADETFHVLAGELGFTVGELTLLARAGDTVHVPRGTVHAFRYVGEAPVRFLAILSPSQRMDEYFERLAEIVRDAALPLDERVRGKLAELMTEFGQITGS